MEDATIDIDIHNRILNTMINISEEITDKNNDLVHILDSIKKINEIYINTNEETTISIKYLNDICALYVYIERGVQKEHNKFLNIYCEDYMQCTLVYNMLNLLCYYDINLASFPKFITAVLLILKSYSGKYIIYSEQKIIMFENINEIVEKLMNVIRQYDEEFKATIITNFEKYAYDNFIQHADTAEGYHYITSVLHVLDTLINNKRNISSTINF